MNIYHIPIETLTDEIIITKSRFIASAGFASTVEEAKTFIAGEKQKFPDANHHVYAYRIGYGNSVIEGMSDDGEPSGTAGPPILSILRGTEIGDIVVVVTRYFGGIKLGTGGLVRAYSSATRLVIDALPTELKIPKDRLLLEFEYTYYERMKQFVEQYAGTIESEEFLASVMLEVILPESNTEKFQEDIINLTAGRCEIMQL